MHETYRKAQALEGGFGPLPTMREGEPVSSRQDWNGRPLSEDEKLAIRTLRAPLGETA